MRNVTEVVVYPVDPVFKIGLGSSESHALPQFLPVKGIDPAAVLCLPFRVTHVERTALLTAAQLVTRPLGQS